MEKQSDKKNETRRIGGAGMHISKLLYSPPEKAKKKNPSNTDAKDHGTK